MNRLELEYEQLRKQCKQHRKSQKLSAREVAEYTGSYAQSIYDLERGRNIPGMYKFMEYLDSIGLKIKLEER